MYLKEIKAHGFKSFADKINIELNKGITGIVGPNGSGKSNVVDAVRWVLGEQSIKSLRGDGNMTDVIFSGSKSRNALNVASVTLVLDNSDKYLNTEYNEVAIKRRVYKDGTNEYFLNNEKVRLKDISDLLIDSGIAKESFNIISQGKIEEILSNKPSDRRVIFEEAAGVLKYKKRKEEALRKLEKTHDNMNRVNDIIKELEIQVEPLKEQKEKALNYINIKDELTNIEIALITKDITDINRNYQETKKEVEEITKKLDKMVTSNNVDEIKIEEYKTKINMLDLQIQEINKNLLETTSNVEKTNSKKQLILERQKYNANDTKLHNNLIDLKEKKLKLENDLNNINNEYVNLSKEEEKLTLKLAEKEEEFNKIKEIKNNLQLDISNLNKIELINNNKIDNLKDQIETNSNLPYAVKSVLDNPKLSGIYNVIGNVLEISNEYTLAISTSLGMAASNIIVEDEKAATKAVDYLKNNNIGRATFFPLNVIKPRNIETNIISLIKNMEGFIDKASNLVKYDKKFDNVILNQLGNVIVVDNIDNANKISKEIKNSYKIVTLDGQIINVGGSITGGNQIKTKNIITDKYELDRLIFENKKNKEQILEIENKINEVDYNIKIKEDEIYLINKDLIVIKDSLESKKNIKQELTSSMEIIDLEIRGIENLINGNLTKDEEDVINEYYKLVKEKDNLNNKYNNLIKEKEMLNEELLTFEHNLKKENSLYNELSNNLKNKEIDLNRMDVKLDNLLNNLNESYSLTYEDAKNIYKLEIESSLARNKVNSLKRSLKELGEVNLLAPQEYEKVSTRYEYLLSGREDLVKAETTLLEIINEMDFIMEKEFLETFKLIESNFSQTFKELFHGGEASLKLTDPNNINETGIEIIASPPGKKLTSISLLSGGEKTFTAISLLFAIIKSRPAPFCILDEVEAALDEVNVDSFGKYLLGLKEKTQFIVITHKKKTMEYVDNLYGITMQESGVSKLVSVKLEEIK